MKKQPFRVGDKVTTDFIEADKKVIRTVTKIEKNDSCQSGWIVCLDGGGKCTCCHRFYSVEIKWIDSDWLKPV
jgi:hypothetical protein